MALKIAVHCAAGHRFVKIHLVTIKFRAIHTGKLCFSTYSQTASDHYAVIAEVVRVEIAPEAVLDTTIEGGFNSPDDNEGF